MTTTYSVSDLVVRLVHDGLRAGVTGLHFELHPDWEPEVEAMRTEWSGVVEWVRIRHDGKTLTYGCTRFAIVNDGRSPQIVAGGGRIGTDRTENTEAFRRWSTEPAHG